MIGHRIWVGLNMTLRMLARRRIILISLIGIPAVFLSIVQLTASEKIIPFQLASLDTTVYVEIVQRGVSLVFFSVTATGFLVSFLALNLIQIDHDVNRRLVICGYHPIELMISKVIALFIVILFIAVYLSLIIRTFYSIQHMAGFILGLSLIGFVYGCYGLFVGTLIRGELEGIFLIVLLANIDVGWLQNPVFYADAHNKEIIKYLPGYFPSQATIISSLTDHTPLNAQLSSLFYGSGFLALSMIIFYRRMRKKQ